MALRACRYRLYPNRAQEALLNDTLFSCSLLYNDLLQERREMRKLHHLSIGFWSTSRFVASLGPPPRRMPRRMPHWPRAGPHRDR